MPASPTGAFAVHQIRLFKGVETEVRDMEKEINHWLKDTKARVVHLASNIAPQSNDPQAFAGPKSRQFAPSDLFVAIVYDT
ncbi:MAG TPA: hypothetical protein VMS30_03760 [Phycisphaerales bacterium]|nr:hypothetical protein [Phycisphaerales bacterium]